MLSLFIGKPGSGKSYYAVQKIANMLCDWAAYEHKNDEKFARVIYTNLVLNVEELNKYVSNRLGYLVDISDYLYYTDEDFFFDQNKERYKWWEKLPEGAFAIIDEVHQYLGAESVKDDKDFLETFRNYVSTHRHRKHDLIFITQHTDSIQRSILAMAADAYHIINIKNKVFPILNIPFADFDVVKEAFGIKHQYIQILYGNYLSKSFKRESVFTELLRPEIYALYKSHTQVTEGSAAEDRPSLNLSRIGAILWFIKRHFFSVGLKVSIVVFCVYFAYSLLMAFPEIVSSAFKDMGKPKTAKTEKKEEVKLGSPAVVPANSDETPRPAPSIRTSESLVDDKIYGFLANAIITQRGIFYVGQKVRVNGHDREIVNVDFRNGKVYYRDVHNVKEIQNEIKPVVPFDGSAVYSRLQEQPQNTSGVSGAGKVPVSKVGR